MRLKMTTTTTSLPDGTTVTQTTTVYTPPSHSPTHAATTPQPPPEIKPLRYTGKPLHTLSARAVVALLKEGKVTSAELIDVVELRLVSNKASHLSIDHSTIG